jgi:hypothetical protein
VSYAHGSADVIEHPEVADEEPALQDEMIAIASISTR